MRDNKLHIKMPIAPARLFGVLAALCLARGSDADDTLPDIGSFVSDWIPYRRGLGHKATEGAPLHGLALPVNNNVLGSCMADENALAVRSLTFPPFTQGPLSTVARDQSQLGRLIVNGEKVYTNQYQWTPWSFRRTGEVGGSSRGGRYNVTTEVSLPLNASGVVMRADITTAKNAAGGDNVGLKVEVEILAAVRSFPSAAVNCSELQWVYPANEQQICWNWYAPRPYQNQTTQFSGVWDASRNVAVYMDSLTDAVTAVAFSRSPSSAPLSPASPGDPIVVSFSPDRRGQGGSSVSVGFGMAVSIGSSTHEGVEYHVRRAMQWAAYADNEIDVKARHDRQVRFEKAFDPNDDYFSGSLPILSSGTQSGSNTSADAVAMQRHYYSSILQTIDMERHGLPLAPKGSRRVFVTGSGENATTNTFFWDLDYASTTFIMLDPETFKTQILLWIPQVSKGWGIDWMTNHSVGNHYSANVFTIFGGIHHYVAITGDTSFLQQSVAGLTVDKWLDHFAFAWKNRTVTANGTSPLADYGPPSALLECVPSYAHYVAGWNAANVWMMNALADLRAAQGKLTEARDLRLEAAELGTSVLKLYVPGEGVFRASYPNGSSQVVRHVADLVYVSRFMSEGLGQTRKKEMSQFAQRELMTPHWMRAQSLSDKFANYSDRTDHGPNGAYPGWIPLTMSAVASAGDWAAATAFLTSTASVISLGPYGQALSVTPQDETKLHGYSVVPYKPFEFTLWIQAVGLSFADTIVTTFMGLDTNHAALLPDGAPPVFDPNTPRGNTAPMRLSGLYWRGTAYNVDLAVDAGPKYSRAVDSANSDVSVNIV